jgi:hypothetical protein
VHTPGAVLKKPLADFTDDDFDHLIDLDTRSAFTTLRAPAISPTAAAGTWCCPPRSP